MPQVCCKSFQATLTPGHTWEEMPQSMWSANASLLEHSCTPNAPGSFPHRQHNFNRKLHVHVFLLPQVKSNIHACFITVGCTNFMCGEHQIECALQVHMYMYSTCIWSTGQSLSLEVTVVHILLGDTLRESTVRLVPVLAHNDIYLTFPKRSFWEDRTPGLPTVQLIENHNSLGHERTSGLDIIRRAGHAETSPYQLCTDRVLYLYSCGY